VHALLRRELALHAGRDAVRVDIGEIENHLRAAGTRSQDWISQALALNQRLQKSFFNYRFAAGGLEKSLRSLVDTSVGLRNLVPAGVVIEQDLILADAEQLGEGWIKITPKEPLAAGEYALAEMLGKQGINSYVWDFGMHPDAPANLSVIRPEKQKASPEESKTELKTRDTDEGAKR